MPGTTDTFAIQYPCEIDTVTPASFTSHALSTEAALATVWAKANTVLRPPAVSIYNSAGQSVATGVGTTLTYNSVVHDRGGFWNPGSPNLVTLPSDGTYFAASTSSGNLTGNVTSVRFVIVYNGSEYAYWESQNTGALSPASDLNVHAMIPGAMAGDTVAVTVLYTGTQPTLNFFGRLTVTRLAIP